MRLGPRLTVALAVVTGLVLLAFMILFKSPPQRTDGSVTARPVRVMTVEAQTVFVEARGYGEVLPARTWRAVAKVGGQVTWLHPQLESGNLLPEGAHLLQLDTTRYALAEASAQADLEGVAADLRKIEQEVENVRLLLDLEERRLALAVRELERTKALTEQNALSRTRYDEQQRLTLQQEQAVQSLRSQLQLLPATRDTLEARKARLASNLALAREDLKDARFAAPWDLRVHGVDVESGQQINTGQTLFVADDIAEAEVTVQLQVADLRRVLLQLPAEPASELTAGIEEGATSESEPRSELIPAVPATDAVGLPDANIGHTLALLPQLPLAALTVQLRPVNIPGALWEGRLSRVASSLDPSTRTLQAVITVADPYRNASPPSRPALVRGMFVAATISAPTAKPVLVIPASAVHEGVVYLVDAHNRLRRQAVVVAWQQADSVVIAEGLEAGDQLVLDDLMPAVDGMLLAPQPFSGGDTLVPPQAKTAGGVP